MSFKVIASFKPCYKWNTFNTWELFIIDNETGEKF